MERLAAWPHYKYRGYSTCYVDTIESFYEFDLEEKSEICITQSL